MKILSSFTHPSAVPNPWFSLFNGTLNEKLCIVRQYNHNVFTPCIGDLKPYGLPAILENPALYLFSLFEKGQYEHSVVKTNFAYFYIHNILALRRLTKVMSTIKQFMQ